MEVQSNWPLKLSQLQNKDLFINKYKNFNPRISPKLLKQYVQKSFFTMLRKSKTASENIQEPEMIKTKTE